jgi:formylglycine-generating enzyme required for sulfatase activity
MDIDAIPFGVDFRKYIHGAVGECDVLLTIIGKKWFGRTPRQGRRLDDPRDWVRIEIEAALAKDIPVIPVLIDEVRMPAESELPASIAGLAYLNAIAIDHGRDFHVHVDRLIRGIERLLKSDVPQRPHPPAPVAEAPKLITNSIGMRLILIPAGEFQMGSPDSDTEAYDIEQPQHHVQITQRFYLGVMPVTQGQYRAITSANPSHFKGSDDLPVEQVSWEEAWAFCEKLSALEKQQLGGARYRLPTEAEWEYACRAGRTTRFSFGDANASLWEYAWFRGNSDGQAHPVGQKRPNAWGLYDMHGNVWEWCGDGYDGKYYANTPSSDPLGPSGQAAGRVLRGGGWCSNPRSCRAAVRNGLAPGDRNNILGFRVARVRSR